MKIKLMEFVWTHCQFAILKGARSANNIAFAFLEKNMFLGKKLKA